MSAVALATLREHWGKLSISRVNRTIAREPEDVLSIDLPSQHLSGHSTHLPCRRLSEVPAEYRSRVRVSWRSYYGFTQDRVYFHKDDFQPNELQQRAGIDESGSEFDRPANGAVIVGEPVNGPKGLRLKRWYLPSEPLQTLMAAALHGNTRPEKELYSKLLQRGYPDVYWMFAALVFFDNVQLFVDAATKRRKWKHPLFSQAVHDKWMADQIWDPSCGSAYWNYMWITGPISAFVHEMSHWLKEPKWWEEFQAGTGWQHPHQDNRHGGSCCRVCELERRRQDDPDSFSYLH